MAKVLACGCFSSRVHIGAVDPVLPPEGAGTVADVLRDLGIGDDALPRIAFVAARDLPTGVAGVVGGAALLPVVVVIADEVGVDAVVLEDFGHGVVEGFERAPTAVQEVVAPGVQFAAAGHARHAAHVAVGEGDGAFRQPLEVGRVDPIAAVGREHAAIEGVEHNHNGFCHCVASGFRVGV